MMTTTMMTTPLPTMIADGPHLKLASSLDEDASSPPVVADILSDLFTEDDTIFSSDAQDCCSLIDELTNSLFGADPSTQATEATEPAFTQHRKPKSRFSAPRIPDDGAVLPVEAPTASMGEVAASSPFSPPRQRPSFKSPPVVVKAYADKLLVAVQETGGVAAAEVVGGNSNNDLDLVQFPDAVRARYATAKQYRKHVAIPRYLRKRARRDWQKAAAPLYPSRTAAASRRKRENGQFMEHHTEWVSVGDYSQKKKTKRK